MSSVYLHYSPDTGFGFKPVRCAGFRQPATLGGFLHDVSIEERTCLAAECATADRLDAWRAHKLASALRMRAVDKLSHFLQCRVEPHTPVYLTVGKVALTLAAPATSARVVRYPQNGPDDNLLAIVEVRS